VDIGPKTVILAVTPGLKGMITTRTHRLPRGKRLGNAGIGRPRRPLGAKLTRCHHRAACAKARPAGIKPRF
jgi:hypothetical protein